MVVTAIQQICLLPSMLHSHDWILMAQSVTDPDLWEIQKKHLTTLSRPGLGNANWTYHRLYASEPN